MRLLSGYKREQYTCFVVIYGILAVPVAGLTAYSLDTFNAFIGLYVSFNIAGFLAGAWLNVFVPYAMQRAAPDKAAVGPRPFTATDNRPQQDVFASGNQSQSRDDPDIGDTRLERERQGVKISVAGNNALNVGMLSFFLITIGLTYASAEASIYAGLYMTTTAGGICILLALAAWRFLPEPTFVVPVTGRPWWSLPFYTCKLRLSRS